MQHENVKGESMIAMPTKKVSSCNESSRVKILANDVEGY